MVNTETVIRHALQESIPITLVVNKIDRLILELRLPPADAFYKIKHTIEDINTFIRLVYSTHFQACADNGNRSQWHRPKSGSPFESREGKRVLCKYGYGLVFFPSVICPNVC